MRVKRTYGTSVDLEPSGRLMLRIGASYPKPIVDLKATRVRALEAAGRL